MERGIFITTEGNDGSGKSTQTKLIEEYLLKKGLEVVFIREPGGTSIGEKIRNIILDTENSEMSIITEMLLYAASRAQLVREIIKPSLEQGKIVLCDRFLDSSLVYQGVARGIGMEVVEKTNEIVLQDIKPDITFFFDIDPKVALERRVSTTKADRMELEDITFHEKVYRGYKELAEKFKERIVEIESSRNIEEIFQDVVIYLEKKLEEVGFYEGRREYK